ncbi:MAG: ABC transporter substrate-binding protein [Deltaproteobacteria bacterium]|nr:ABC transporter substrate-binding protein [Deltaproteobacteria bacterium]
MGWIGLCVFLLACQPAEAPQATSRTVTDLLGRKVEVPVHPERLVASGPGALRILAYLGATGKVVGVEGVEHKLKTPYNLAHPELRELPVIGAGGPAHIGEGPDPEATLVTHPDLAVVAHLDIAAAEALQARLGVPVLVVSQGNLGQVDERLHHSLALLGEVLDLPERAAAVTQLVEAERDTLAARAASSPPLEGVYVGGVAFKGFQGLGSTTVSYLPLEVLGQPHLSQQLTGQGPYRTVDPEQLLAWQPRAVLLDASAREVVEAERLAHPGVYEGLDAFKGGRVYTVLPYNTYSTNLGTALADAWVIGAALLPEGFAGVDPAVEADRVYEQLLGVPVYSKLQAVYLAPAGGAGL